MSTKSHPKNVHEKSPKKRTSRGHFCPRDVTKSVHEKSPLLSTRSHLLCPRDVCHPKKCWRNVQLIRGSFGKEILLIKFRTFFLTECHNNFGNKIPILYYYKFSCRACKLGIIFLYTISPQRKFRDFKSRVMEYGCHRQPIVWVKSKLRVQNKNIETYQPNLTKYYLVAKGLSLYYVRT